jgi:hypothetical protein
MPTGPTPSLEGLEPLAPDEPTPNGHPPAAESFEAKLIHDLDGAIRERRDQANAAEAEVEAAKAKLAEVNAVLRRYEDTRRRLLGEPKPESVKRRGRAREGEHLTRKMVAAERMAEIEAFVLAYAADHEEFRQIDIRTAPHSPITNSGAATQAFEQLRQDGILRLARKDGNNKWFRLTAAGMAKAAGR